MTVSFEIPTAEIMVGQGSFTVRGLNSEDLTLLLTGYLEEAKAIVAQYSRTYRDGEIPQSAVADIAMDLARLYPLMAAEIISRCADAPEEVEKFRKLSFVKAAQALHEIMRLTTEDGPELKNLLGGLANLLEARGLQLGPLTKSLQAIIGTSESLSST